MFPDYLSEWFGFKLLGGQDASRLKKCSSAFIAGWASLQFFPDRLGSMLNLARFSLRLSICCFYCSKTLYILDNRVLQCGRCRKNECELFEKSLDLSEGRQDTLEFHPIGGADLQQADPKYLVG